MVTFDTMALIWGVQKVARPGQEVMIDWTAFLLEELVRRGTRLAITSVALGEFLSHFDDDERATQLVTIASAFVILPYDARAAAIAADLWNRRNEAKSTATRVVLKADIQIVASAIAGGAGTIYSHDDNLRKLANIHEKIIGKPIPDPASGKLF